MCAQCCGLCDFGGVFRAAFRRGDWDAWEAAHKGYGPGLLRFLERLLRSRDDAEDVLQLTFVKGWINRDRYDRKRCPRPWLYKIAYRLAMTFLGTEPPEDPFTVLQGEDPDEDFEVVLKGKEHGPPDLAIGEEQRREVNRCVDNLPDRERFVIAFWMASHVTLTEMGEFFDMTVLQVTRAVNNAKRRVRHCLEKKRLQGGADEDVQDTVDQWLRKGNDELVRLQEWEFPDDIQPLPATHSSGSPPSMPMRFQKYLRTAGRRLQTIMVALNYEGPLATDEQISEMSHEMLISFVQELKDRVIAHVSLCFDGVRLRLGNAPERAQKITLICELEDLVINLENHVYYLFGLRLKGSGDNASCDAKVANSDPYDGSTLL